tara:strand:+ start:5999 stop:7513 length:1515 start_codon:yes stop_codon:yes gene_type:complete
MKIYESEIKDGLGDLLLKENSIACCAVAETYKPESSQENVDNLKKIIAQNSSAGEVALAQNEDQIDLYYLKSILVSTGWNKNDDVFDSQELWSARDTPEDKPFNFMHDEKDIIGHITGNVVVDFDGAEIDTETEEIPNAFNILTTSVIYTEWSDKDQRDRMQKIVSEIEEGKWFVSMECLFPDFDYALVSPDGSTKVLPRNEASAFLTKHLRSYGGSGKYEDYRVGRLLRNLSFSGKGLVSKPANPRSVILEGNELFDESKAEILTISSIKENVMSDTHDKQILDLQKELAEAKSQNEELRDKVAAEQRAEFEEKIQALEATIAEQASSISEKEEALAAKETELTQAQEALAAKEEILVAKEEALAEMQKKEATMKRKAQLEEAGFEAEEALATVEDFNHLDDETFDKIVAAMKKKATKRDEEKEEDKEKAAPKEEKAVMKKKAELEEEVDTAEAGEEVLETVEESAEVAIAEAVGEEDPAESLRAVASEWLGSILQSVPKEDN